MTDETPAAKKANAQRYRQQAAIPFIQFVCIVAIVAIVIFDLRTEAEDVPFWVYGSIVGIAVGLDPKSVRGMFGG